MMKVLSIIKYLKHRCSVCGQYKTDAELNGFDPISGDYSRAYCRRVGTCNSDQASDMIDDLFAHGL